MDNRTFCSKIQKNIRSETLGILQNRLVLSTSGRNFSSGLSSLVTVKTRSHDAVLKIRLLLVPKIGSCKHIENDLPTQDP